MRVTAEAKEATRQSILDATETLLRERGWEKVGTREIAAEAGIANGTLFNYFPNKEAIVAALVSEALRDAARAPEDGTVEERLFALISGGLRRLRAYRPFLSEVIHDAEGLRDGHLCEVERVIGRPLSPVLRHLYWTLYSGVITFWAADDSRKQEQTLALADHSVRLFVASLAMEKQR